MPSFWIKHTQTKAQHKHVLCNSLATSASTAMPLHFCLHVSWHFVSLLDTMHPVPKYLVVFRSSSITMKEQHICIMMQLTANYVHVKLFLSLYKITQRASSFSLEIVKMHLQRWQCLKCAYFVLYSTSQSFRMLCI